MCLKVVDTPRCGRTGSIGCEPVCHVVRARKDTWAGYQRQLHTKVGEASIRVPKLRTLPFETAIIEPLG